MHPMFSTMRKKKIIAIEKKASAVVYALHKFMHYLLGDMFIFYIDHMALLYLIKKTLGE